MATRSGKLAANDAIKKFVHTRRHRHWIEYHKKESVKTLGERYHLIQLSSLSSMIAAERGLMPFKQWISMSEETVIHGPFNFATMNNRKTRDRVDSKDWISITTSCHMYNNAPPQLQEPRI
eukprot:7355606-Ditylum_brightwellii.AAC.1